MQHRTRHFTNLVVTAPQEARERFASVIDIGEGGDFALQPALVDAVADAEHGANDLFTNGHTPTSLIAVVPNTAPHTPSILPYPITHAHPFPDPAMN